MIDHVRTVKTSSGAIAVQIVRYEKRKRIILAHIGSTHTKEELEALRLEALIKIEETASQKSLFSKDKPKASPIIIVNKSEYLGDRYTFLYEVLSQIFHLFDFQKLKNQLLLDLVLIRIVQPASKLESLELLSEMFGIGYKRGNLYQAIASFTTLKDNIEKQLLSFAKKSLSFDFSIVFYDVTTLYFESLTQDADFTDEKGIITKGLRRNGFSKDNKSNQPQIVIGLIVTKEGFPVAYDVFEGNTFEGKTFISTITKFKNTHEVKTLTVVADAAMISLDNIQELIKNNLSYIVGARTANLKFDQIKQINKKLNQKDSASTRIDTERGILICDFSINRYRKDKREMEKQITKAQKLILDNKALTRTKFIKTDKASQTLNTALVEKTKLLLGIKGYYTNLLGETNEIIIKHYHNLWHVELAFRIAKSDLQTRPIYHFKRQTIEAHILICFMALAVCKYMELKTGRSIKKIVKLLKSITDARILSELTGEIIIMRKKLPEEVKELWKILSPTKLSH